MQRAALKGEQVVVTKRWSLQYEYSWNSAAEGVERLEEMAFDLCPFLRPIIMPGVKVVEKYAFNGCGALIYFECGKLERIGVHAFAVWESLSSISAINQVHWGVGISHLHKSTNGRQVRWESGIDQWGGILWLQRCQWCRHAGRSFQNGWTARRIGSDCEFTNGSGGPCLVFDGRGQVDLLIVATAGLSASSIIRLEGLDLDTCKASFDGKKFHIPDPHLTFAGKTKMESNRRAVVGSYVRHHHGEGLLEPIDLCRLASATIRAVRAMFLVHPSMDGLILPTGFLIDTLQTTVGTILLNKCFTTHLWNWSTEHRFSSTTGAANSSNVYASIRSVASRLSTRLRPQKNSATMNTA